MKLQKRILIPLALVIIFIAFVVIINLAGLGFSPLQEYELEFYVGGELLARYFVELAQAPSVTSFEICDAVRDIPFADEIRTIFTGKDAMIGEIFIADFSPENDGRFCSKTAGSADVGLSPDDAVACGQSAPACNGDCPEGQVCKTGPSITTRECACPETRDEFKVKARTCRGYTYYTLRHKNPTACADANACGMVETWCSSYRVTGCGTNGRIIIKDYACKLLPVNNPLCVCEPAPSHN